MRIGDVPLGQVCEGMFLFLAEDPLLDDRLAAYLFCEPTRVLAIHRHDPTEWRGLLYYDRMVVRAVGLDNAHGREIGIEMSGPDGGRVLVWFPDDRHRVEAVNLPDR